MFLFNPALTIDSFSKNLSPTSLKANLAGIGISIALVIVCTIVGKLLSFFLARRDRDLRSILEYNLSISNYGYFGNPLMMCMFDGATLLGYLLFTFPVTVFCYTYFKKVQEGDMRVRLRDFVSPLYLTIVIGAVIGLCGIRLPEVLSETVSSLENCVGQISMLLMGMVLGRCDLRSCFNDWRNYLYAILRLVLLPLFFGGALYLLGVHGPTMLFAGCTLGMPFGSNPIIFRENVGICSDRAAATSFLSYPLCVITVPLVFSVFNYLQALP